MKIKEYWFYIAMLIICICSLVVAGGGDEKNIIEMLWIIVAALWVVSSWMKSAEAKYWEKQYHESDDLAGRCLKNAEEALKLVNEVEEENKDLLDAMNFYGDNMMKAVHEIERLDPTGNQVVAEILQAVLARKKQKDKKMIDDKIDEVSGPEISEITEK